MSRKLNIEDLSGKGMGTGLATRSKRRGQQWGARLEGFEQPVQFTERAMRHSRAVFREGLVRGRTD